jgi:hypothetical protein
MYVAQNPNTPVDTLTTMAKDSDGYVRMYVARNPNTPVDTLTTMAKDSDGYVRRAAKKRL